LRDEVYEKTARRFATWITSDGLLKVSSAVTMRVYQLTDYAEVAYFSKMIKIMRCSSNIYKALNLDVNKTYSYRIFSAVLHAILYNEKALQYVLG